MEMLLVGIDNRAFNQEALQLLCRLVIDGEDRLGSSWDSKQTHFTGEAVRYKLDRGDVVSSLTFWQDLIADRIRVTPWENPCREALTWRPGAQWKKSVARKGQPLQWSASHVRELKEKLSEAGGEADAN